KQLEETQHDKDQLVLNIEALRAELDQMRLRADPTWAVSQISGSPWQTATQTPTAPVQCCGARRKADWQPCEMSLPRYKLLMSRIGNVPSKLVSWQM
ncbi:PPFIA1 isoform 21, partial [Pan troglodytes]